MSEPNVSQHDMAQQYILQLFFVNIIKANNETKLNLYYNNRRYIKAVCRNSS
jgi:hypothetical protein